MRTPGATCQPAGGRGAERAGDGKKGNQRNGPKIRFVSDSHRNTVKAGYTGIVYTGIVYTGIVYTGIVYTGIVYTGIVYTGILAIPDPSSHVSKFCIAIRLPENLGIGVLEL